MNPVEIAVVGCGLIGKEHVQRIQNNPDCKLSAIVDPTDPSIAFAEEQHCKHFPNLESLFEDHVPAGVIIATPNPLHFPQAIQSIDAGCAVLVEKPLADSLADAEQLAAIAKERQAKVLVGHHRAHSPILAKAHQVIADGLIGKVVAVQGSATFYKPDHYFEAAQWRTRKGGGPILINLIHEIGNLRHLCGEIASVQAISSNSTRGYEVEDTAAMLFKFRSGALGTFILSDTAASPRSWEQTSQENPSYSTYPDEDCYVISGTAGSLSVPTMRLKRFSEGQERSWWKELECSVVDIQREDPLTVQLAHFCRVIRNEAEPLVSAYDGLQNLKVIDAIMRAIDTGERIDLA